jgi:hypothetical protein
MSGGTVENNMAASGGGVYVGHSWYYSPAEYYYGTTFTMTGGAVTKNSASSGGGVYLSQTNFIMSGKALIDGNSAQEGSGIYLSPGTLTMSGEARIYPDNAVCLNYIPKTGSGVHQSSIHIAGTFPGYNEIARIELRGGSNVTGVNQWDRKILQKTSSYKGELPNTRFVLQRFIPPPAADAGPAISLIDYRINGEGELVQDQR